MQDAPKGFYVWIFIKSKTKNSQLCYSDKLAHTQVVINCPYSNAHLCTSEATLAYNLDPLHVDDVMSYYLLTTVILFFHVLMYILFDVRRVWAGTKRLS